MKKIYFLGICLGITVTIQSSEKPKEPSPLKEQCLNATLNQSDSPSIKDRLHTAPTDLLRTIIERCPQHDCLFLAVKALACIAKREPINARDAELIADSFPTHMWQLLHDHDFDVACDMTFPAYMFNYGNEEKIKNALINHLVDTQVTAFNCLQDSSIHYDTNYLKKILDQQQRCALHIDPDDNHLTIAGKDTYIEMAGCEEFNYTCTNRSIKEQYALVGPSKKTIACIFSSIEQVTNASDTTIFIAHATHIHPHISISFCEHYQVLACAYTPQGNFVIHINNQELEPASQIYTFEVPRDFLAPSLSLKQIMLAIMRRRLKKSITHTAPVAEKLAKMQQCLPIAKKLLYSEYVTWPTMHQYEINSFIELLKDYQEDFLIDNGVSIRKRYPSATSASAEKIKQLLPVTLQHLPVICTQTLLHHADTILQEKNIKKIIRDMPAFIEILQQHHHSDETIRATLRPMLKRAIDRYMHQYPVDTPELAH